MDFLKNLLPDFGQMLHISYVFIFQWYGWVLFVIGLLVALWRVYYLEIEHQYVHSQDWIFLSFKVPRENLASTMAVETIFSQMHALHVGKTFPEKYIEGQIQLWYSMEIVSMGGKISFIMRIPARMKDTVESAFYAHYPQAEISEISDYMENFHYDADKPGDYEIFGSEWKLNTTDVVPIKTYLDFEHPAAEEKVIDPLANFFEGMAKIKPYEFIGFQILTQPLADDEWQSKGELKAKELTGEEIPHKASFINFLLTPFEWFAKLSYKEALLSSGHGHAENENKPRNNWLNMTEAEKLRVTLIEKKIGKPGYKTKIRMLYIVPKELFDNSRKGLMCGFYRPMGSVMTNKLRPDVSITWTGADYAFSRSLEKPYLDWLIRYKKRHLFKGYKDRAILIGLPSFILNTEELATLYHFPITTETTLAPSAVEKTESKKSQPPANLPIAEI